MTSPIVFSAFCMCGCRHQQRWINPQCNLFKNSVELHQKVIWLGISSLWCNYIVWEDSSSECLFAPSHESCRHQYWLGFVMWVWYFFVCWAFLNCKLNLMPQKAVWSSFQYPCLASLSRRKGLRNLDKLPFVPLPSPQSSCKTASQVRQKEPSLCGILGSTMSPFYDFQNTGQIANSREDPVTNHTSYEWRMNNETRLWDRSYSSSGKPWKWLQEGLPIICTILKPTWKILKQFALFCWS